MTLSRRYHISDLSKFSGARIVELRACKRLIVAASRDEDGAISQKRRGVPTSRNIQVARRCEGFGLRIKQFRAVEIHLIVGVNFLEASNDEHCSIREKRCCV